MPQLPVVVWVVLAVLVALILAMCAGTVVGVRRAAARWQLVQRPAAHVVIVDAVAAIPWLVAWLAPINIELDVHSIGPLIGWLLAALLAFSLLVLLPLAALLTTALWWRRSPRWRRTDVSRDA